VLRQAGDIKADYESNDGSPLFTRNIAIKVIEKDQVVTVDQVAQLPAN